MARALLILVLTTASALASSPAEAQAAALADLKTLPLEDAYTTRYLWYAGDPTKAKEVHAVMQLHWNFLSRYRRMRPVVAVKPGLFRVDLDHIKADPGVWERAEAFDYFFHSNERLLEDTTLSRYWPGGIHTDGKSYDRGEYTETRKKGALVRLHIGDPKVINELRKLTSSECPILEARFFLAHSARQIDWNEQETGFGYYDFLGLKKRDDFFDLVALDAKFAAKKQAELRAALARSGVLPKPRQIVGLRGIYGWVFFTLDAKSSAKGNIATSRLTPGTFKHAAEEHYGPLPNGLPATYACSNEGVQQNFAPADALGLGDTSVLNQGVDTRIHVHIACLRCHNKDILKPIDDFVRRTFRIGTGALIGTKDKKKLEELERLYLEPLDPALSEARTGYINAVTKATVTVDFPKGMEITLAVKAYAGLYHDYLDKPVTLAVAAREFGMKGPDFSAALKRYASPPPIGLGKLNTSLAGYIADPPDSLSRIEWEQLYPIARKVLRGEIVIEEEEES